EEALIRLDLRILQCAGGVLHRQRMKMEDVAEHAHLVLGRRRQVGPQDYVGRGVEPRGVDPIAVYGLPVVVDVDLDHPDIAAWAAASRATGTRTGEKLT